MTNLESVEEDPADRRMFYLTEEQWDAFWEMLDAAIAKDLPKLRKLMAEDWSEETDD